MDKCIATMISELITITFDSGLFGSLDNALSTFNKVVNDKVLDVMKNSVFGIGASMLTLFMMMELMSLIQRSGSNTGGLSSIEIPAYALLKFGIYVFLYCNIGVILSAIEEIGADVASSVLTGLSPKGAVSTGITATTSFELTPEQLAVISSSIKDLNFFTQLGVFLQLSIQWVMVHLIITIVNVMLVFRVFEIWIMLMFAPIPLATYASSEFKQTAINYIKSFAAVCLQGAIICACFKIYSLFVSGCFVGFEEGMAIKGFVNDFMQHNLAYVAALAVSVFNSGRIAKSIMNAI